MCFQCPRKYIQIEELVHSSRGRDTVFGRFVQGNCSRPCFARHIAIRERRSKSEQTRTEKLETLREEDSIFYMHPPVVNGEKKPRRLCVPEKFARCGFVDKCVFSARENTYRSRSLFHSSSLPRSNDTFKK